MLIRALPLSLLLGLAACDGKSNPAPAASPAAPAKKRAEFRSRAERVAALDAVEKDLVGIYEITSELRAEGTCEVSGEGAKPKGDGFFVVMRTHDEHLDSLSIHSCTDAADCKAKDPARSISTYIYNLIDADAGGATGQRLSGGALSDGTCKRGELTALRLAKTDDGVRLERDTHFVDSAPVDKMCSTDDVEKGAAGKPCTESVVLVGKKVTN